MYAIIETGGKQYKVQTGDILNIEKINGKKGEIIKFDKVLLVGGQNDKVLVGKPYVNSAITEAEIVDDEYKADKILTIKYKRRKQYRRTIGHRQKYFRVLITKIDDGQGGITTFDSSRKKEVLTKASIKCSDKKEAKNAQEVTTKKTTKTKTKAKK
jgi:large subunit ribosomal protein L21